MFNVSKEPAENPTRAKVQGHYGNHSGVKVLQAKNRQLLLALIVKR